MKKYLKTLALACLTLIAATTIAQNINLCFTGTFTNGDYARLDSVKVENLNRNWTETLVYPDTVLSFNQTGISGAERSELELQSYPNPFNGKTSVRVFLPQSGNVTLQIHNLTGQKIAEAEKVLNAGEHSFGITLKNSEINLMTIKTANGQKTIKLLNNSSSASNSIIYNGINMTEKRLSSQNSQIGDMLKYTGYTTVFGIVLTSREITQSQTASENFSLLFDTVNYSLPTVTTTAASNISDSSAVSGGNVTDSGGLTVFARGVCWDTATNPTISDSHTTDGTGLGTFNSNITRLLPNTTYHVRAYATNAAGTAYGAEITFLTEDTVPVGALHGVFSIGDNRQVRFSKGNLQYSTVGTHTTADSTAPGTWRFALNQWDTIGANNIMISASYTGWIDLFGWGTSGWNSGAVCYQPYSSSPSFSNYHPGGSYTNNLTGTYANADWGVYNAISNGGNRPGLWRTLSKVEWDTLLYHRTTTSGIRYAKATVNGIPGLIIAPDYCDTLIYILDSINNARATFTSNVITSNQWTILEGEGCVFLPTAGSRTWGQGSRVTGVRFSGKYWTTTRYDGGYSDSDYNNAYVMSISNSYMSIGDGLRSLGTSVRLVQDVQP